MGKYLSEKMQESGCPVQTRGKEGAFHHQGENDLNVSSGKFDGTIPCYNDANFGEHWDGPS